MGTWLREWNRLTLAAWLVAPPVLVLTYFAAWGLMKIHGSGRNDPTMWRTGLTLLVLCGAAGLAAWLGVGSRGGERPRGRVLGALLVPLGVLAAGTLVKDLWHYGW